MTLETDIAWAAGLFEGEGCIHADPYFLGDGTPRYRFVLSLGMTDQDVVEKFAAVVGYGRVRAQRRTDCVQEHWKQQYIWEIGSREHCLRIIGMFLPYLGRRRLQKVAEILPLMDSVDRRSGNPASWAPALESLRGEVLSLSL